MKECNKLSFAPADNGFPSPDLGYGAVTAGCPMTGEPYIVLGDEASVRRGLLSTGVVFAKGPDHILTGAEVQRPDGLLRLNGPELRRYRNILNPHFSARATEAKRSQTIGIASAVVNAIIPKADGVIDFSESVAEPIVSRAVCESMGLPIEDWPFLLSSAEASLAIMKDPETREKSVNAWDELYTYFGEKADEKRANPDDGIISRLVADLDSAGFTMDETVSTLASVSNGFPAVLPVFNVAMTVLTQHPEIVATCLENPEQWKDVVQEALRYKAHFSVLLPRVVTQDMQLGDTMIESGTVVLPSITAATRDPDKFEFPDAFCPDQRGPKNIVFGAGGHFCPGAEMTKQWMEEGFRAFFDRFPNASLAVPSEELAWQKGSLSVPKDIPIKLN